MKKKNQLYISHGKVTHPIGQKCRVCDKVMKEFGKWKALKHLRNTLREFKREHEK